MTEAALASLGRFIRGVGYNPDKDLRARPGSDTVELLRANNVHDGRLVLDEVQHVHRRRVRSDQYLTDGDVLICAANGSKRLVGKAAQVWLPDSRELTLGAFMMSFRPNPAKVFPAYVAQQFHSNKYRDWVELLLSGSSINNLRPSAVGGLGVWLPNSEEQQSIAQALMDADELIAALERLIAKKQAIKQGMMQQLLTGRTRLPGYTDEWAWRPFPEVMIRMNAKKHQVPASSYNGVGHIPVVDQGQEPIIGYTDRVDIAFDPGAGGVVVFGDHTCITKFVDFRFAVGADGTQLVKGLPGNSTSFMAHALMANPIVSTGYNRHFKLLREKVLPVPRLAEQEAIASVLRDSETEVNALSVRLRKARAIKTGMMQQLLTGHTRLQVGAVS